MTEVWPSDVQKRLRQAPIDTIRPPRCLLFMPFDKKFDDVATLIHDTVTAVFKRFKDFFELPQVDRLDWISTSGAIQQQMLRMWVATLNLFAPVKLDCSFVRAIRWTLPKKCAS
jgi:hypothetical protein